MYVAIGSSVMNVSCI